MIGKSGRGSASRTCAVTMVVEGWEEEEEVGGGSGGGRGGDVVKEGVGERGKHSCTERHFFPSSISHLCHYPVT